MQALRFSGHLQSMDLDLKDRLGILTAILIMV